MEDVQGVAEKSYRRKGSKNVPVLALQSKTYRVYLQVSTSSSVSLLSLLSILSLLLFSCTLRNQNVRTTCLTSSQNCEHTHLV